MIIGIVSFLYMYHLKIKKLEQFQDLSKVDFLVPTYLFVIIPPPNHINYILRHKVTLCQHLYCFNLIFIINVAVYLDILF